MKQALPYCINPGARGASVAHEWLLHGSGAGDAGEPKLPSEEAEPIRVCSANAGGVLGCTFTPSLASGCGDPCFLPPLKHSQSLNSPLLSSNLGHVGRLEMRLTWASLVSHNIKIHPLVRALYMHFKLVYEHIIFYPKPCVCGSSLHVYYVFIVTNICRECEQRLFSW